MTPEEKAMNTAMCLHMSEFIALFFAPFMSITGKRKLPDMRIRGNDCGSAQHGAIRRRLSWGFCLNIKKLIIRGE